MNSERNHCYRRFSVASLHTIDVSLSDIDQLLVDDNENPRRSSIPTLRFRNPVPQARDYKIQNKSLLKSDNAIQSNVNVGYNSNGHRQHRRNTLDSTMSELSFDKTLCPIESANCDTFSHGQTNTIPYTVKPTQFDHSISSYAVSGPPRRHVSYDDHNDKSNSIPHTSTATHSHISYQKKHFQRRRSTLDSGMSIVSIDLSFCSTEGNKNDTVDQDRHARVTLDRKPRAKSHLYSSREYKQEMRLLMSLMDASERTRKSFRDLKMEMYRGFFMNSLCTSECTPLDQPPQAPADMEEQPEHQKRHSDFARHSRRNKYIPRAIKSSPRKYKMKPYYQSSI